MNQLGRGFRHVTRGGLRFDRCPKAWVKDEARSAALVLSDFVFLDKHKIMPDPGGRLDQSPRFLESVDIIEQTRAEIREAKDRAADAKNRGRGGR